MVTVYGIPNCDTVKKARAWLAARGVDYAFHDYKKVGIAADKVAEWVDAVGLDVVLNRAGTTFRKMPEAERADLDAAQAVALMVAQPSCIRRPIVEYPGGLLVGFREAAWAAAF